MMSTYDYTETAKNNLKKSMHALTGYVNEIFEKIIDDKITNIAFQKEFKIYWVKMEERECASADSDNIVITPDIRSSYFDGQEIIRSNRDVFANIIIQNNLSKDFSLRELYFFIIYTIFQMDERLQRGYINNLPEDYFKTKQYRYLSDANVIMNMYVKYLLELKNLPSYTLFTALSAEQYEKSESQAQIAFCSSQTDLNYTFNSKYEISEGNFRTIRKLMELTKESGLTLIAREERGIWYIVGLSQNTEFEIIIKFDGRLCWSLFERGREVFIFSKGRYCVNLGKRKRNYEFAIENVVLKQEEHREMLKRVTEILAKQKHGTIAVIADEEYIDKEVERLCDKYNKGIRVKRFDFLAENDEHKHQVGLTNIDGAIFLDYQGRCYAIGVILDGEVVERGNSGRGSRFNSTKDYIDWVVREKFPYYDMDNDKNKDSNREITCIGIVVSENGMVDILTASKDHFD